ncbi:MAG: ABC transporter ATP-binding protein [Pseudomonadota bacterium]
MRDTGSDLSPADPGAGTAGAHALALRGLTKCYGTLAAVDGIDLDIPRGSFLTILGPSGGGKTTVLMAIAGFVEPSAGRIMLSGADITGLPPDKRNFGMVFQGYALFPHMTVAENLWFPLRVRGRSRAAAKPAVEAALELVQLAHLAHRYPTQLSGGQQQRVALARALVFQPDLLLLDEPLSALDKKLRADLQWELKSLHQRLGTTFVYVTHDQDEALSMSDEIVIMNQGRIEQQGRPGALYERPASRFVADFLGKSNFLSGRATAVDGTTVGFAAGGLPMLTGLGAGMPPAVGDEVTVALRPEKIAIAPGGTMLATDNRVEGTVTAFSYFGASLQFRIATRALGDMLVTAPAWTCAVTPEEGATVTIGWDAQASVIVRDP